VRCRYHNRVAGAQPSDDGIDRYLSIADTIVRLFCLGVSGVMALEPRKFPGYPEDRATARNKEKKTMDGLLYGVAGQADPLAMWAGQSALVEEVSEIAGPVMRWSAGHGRRRAIETRQPVAP